MTMILIGLGANLEGESGLTPMQSLQWAAVELQTHDGIDVVAGSSIWKTAPVPMSDQPWYHNAVCQIETSLSAQDILQVTASIENKAGRIRLERNEARVLDLDILAYDQDIIETPDLQIPHPRMHERAFVLFPLMEIAPRWKHPLIDKGVEKMILTLDPTQEIERTDIKL